MSAICIFHNGNRRIVEYYKQKFSNLDFKGNWACNEYAENSLYEIYYADASAETLKNLQLHNVKILRHISEYHDDVNNPMPEIDKVFNFADWFHNIVLANLCFANEVVSDFYIKTDHNNIHAVVSTGRAATRHYRLHLKSQNKTPLLIKIDKESYHDYHEFLNSTEATLIWREDSWEAFASWWMAFHDGVDRGFHIIDGTVDGDVPKKGIVVNIDFMKNDWKNLCKHIFNLALMYKFILKKPITVKSTEFIIKNYSSSSSKIPYNKKDYLINYTEAKEIYKKYVDKDLDVLYNNTVNLIKDSQ